MICVVTVFHIQLDCSDSLLLPSCSYLLILHYLWRRHEVTLKTFYYRERARAREREREIRKTLTTHFILFFLTDYEAQNEKNITSSVSQECSNGKIIYITSNTTLPNICSTMLTDVMFLIFMTVNRMSRPDMILHDYFFLCYGL